MKPKFKDLYNWRKVSGMEVEFHLDGSRYGKGIIKSTNLDEKAEIKLSTACKEFKAGENIMVDFQEIVVIDPVNIKPRSKNVQESIARISLYTLD